MSTRADLGKALAVLAVVALLALMLTFGRGAAPVAGRPHRPAPGPCWCLDAPE